MKKILKFCMIVLFSIASGCTLTENFVPETPIEGKSLLVGAVLIENHGIGDSFASKKAGITVNITGKSLESGAEETYRLTTDRNGYFIVQNIPPGAYVIKGVQAYLAPNEKTMVRAFWDGIHMFYELTEREFDFAVRDWPEPMDQKIINLGILHLELGIGSGNDVIYDSYMSLDNQILSLPGIRYTMPNPVDYFKDKYPNLDWW